MNILAQLRAGKMSFKDAAAHLEQMGAALLAKLPGPLHDAINGLISDLKQDASNMIPLADQAAKGVVDTAEAAIEAAVVAAMTQYAPAGTILTPVVHDGLQNLASALKARIDLAAAEAAVALAQQQH